MQGKLPADERASPGEAATEYRQAYKMILLDASIPHGLVEGNGTGCG
jgi:hypothetical protein